MQLRLVMMPLIFLIGGFLRFYLLGDKSLWADEAGTYVFAALPIPDLISRSIATDVHPPLFYILLHFWVLAFGKTEFALRSFPALLGTLSIPLIYVTAKRMFDRKTGLISASLFSLSAFHVHFSQELRGYSLLVFLSLASVIFFLDFLRRERNSTLFMYLITTITMLYCHNFGVFLVVVQNIWFFLFRRLGDPGTDGKMRSWCFMQLAIGGGFALWFLFMWGQLGNIRNAGSLSWVPLPSIQTIFMGFLEFCGATTTCHQGIDFTTDNSAAFLSLFLTAIFSGFAYFSFKITTSLENAPVLDRVDGQKWEVSVSNFRMNFLLSLWLVVPIGTSFLVSHLFQPVFVPRTLIASSIPLFILTARGITTLRNNYFEGTILVLALIFSIGCLDQYYSTPTKCQWNKAVPYIESQAGKGDLLLFDTGHSQAGYEFYASRPDIVRKGFPFENNSITEETVRQLSELGKKFERIWLVRSHSLDFEKYVPTVMGKMFRAGETCTFSGIGIYQYKTK